MSDGRTPPTFASVNSDPLVCRTKIKMINKKMIAYNVYKTVDLNALVIFLEHIRKHHFLHVFESAV